MRIMNSYKNKLNRKKSWIFKPVPNAHLVCMIHQFFFLKLCALFCRNYGTEGFRKITACSNGTTAMRADISTIER